MKYRLAGVSQWLYSVLPHHEVQLEVTPSEQSFDYSVRFRPKRF